MQSYLLFYTLHNEWSVTNRQIKEKGKQLLWAAENNDAEGVLSLLEAGVDVNVQDQNGMTALTMVFENLMEKRMKISDTSSIFPVQ